MPPIERMQTVKCKSQKGGHFLSIAPEPLVSKTLFINNASWEHSNTPHWVTVLWTSDQPDKETSSTWQYSKQTGLQASSGIRTRSPNKRTASLPRFRQRSHQDPTELSVIFITVLLYFLRNITLKVSYFMLSFWVTVVIQQKCQIFWICIYGMGNTRISSKVAVRK